MGSNKDENLLNYLIKKSDYGAKQKEIINTLELISSAKNR